MVKDFYKERKTPRLLTMGIEFFKQKTRGGQIATHAHMHDSIELLLITEGGFFVNLNGYDFEVGAGDLVFIRAGTIHTVRAKDEAENEYFVLKVDTSLVFPLFPEGKIGKYALHLTLQNESSKLFWTKDELSKTEISERFFGLWREMQKPCAAHELYIKSNAFCVVSGIISELEATVKADVSLPSPIYEQIYKSTVYISRHFNEDIDALKMSRVLGMSYSYFSRMFVKITGTSFRKYLNAVRIRSAEHLLLSTGATVTEVSARCGYNNVSHFIATYKAVKGTTPYKSKK